MAELRNLIVVLNDQLDLDAAAFDGFGADLDAACGAAQGAGGGLRLPGPLALSGGKPAFQIKRAIP